MDGSEAGPSSFKKQKTVIKDQNNSSQSEMETQLSDSESETTEYLPEHDMFWSDADEEEESDNDTCDVQNSPERAWQDIPVGMQHFIFSKTNEVLVPLPQSGKPLDYFYMVADENLWNLIVTETNRYAEEYFSTKDASWKSRHAPWKPLTVPELLTFIGLVLHMGTIDMPKLQMYWSQEPFYHVKCFGEKMSGDRFLLILQCLHFSKDPEQASVPEDKLYQIRPLLEYFNSKMCEIYYPGKELSIHESMVLWRGHMLFRQYLRNKWLKYGIKVYMLTEPDGTVLKINVYPGILDTSGGETHARTVVLELVKEKLGNGHAIYLYQFYNSYSLSEKLLQQKTYCTGILRKDRRGNSNEVISAKLKNGESKCQYCEGVMIGKWRNEGKVLYISTEFPNRMIEFVDKRGTRKTKPQPILEYRKHMMRSDDREERIMECYPCPRIPLQWYKKLAVHIIQQMLVNSHFLYNKFSGKKKDILKFSYGNN